MCAIICWRGYMDNLLLRGMIREAAPWGPHAFGYVGIETSNNIYTFKKAIHPNIALKSHEHRIKRLSKCRIGIVHTRKRTTGLSDSDSHAHPFSYENITYVHNGKIKNWEDLGNGPQHHIEVDSQCLGPMIKRKSTREAIGTVGLAWVDGVNLFVYRRGKPLFPVRIKWNFGASTVVCVTHLDNLFELADQHLAEINDMTILDMSQGSAYSLLNDCTRSMWSDIEPYIRFDEPQPIALQNYSGG